VEADQDHFLGLAADQIEKAGAALEAQVQERRDALDTFFDALKDNQEQPRPQQLFEEMQASARVPLRLNNEQMRQLADDPYAVRDDVETQIEAIMTGLAVTRLVGTLEVRLGESLGLAPAELQNLAWEEIAAQVEEAVARALQARRENLLGPQGQIVQDLEAALQRLPDPSNEQSRLGLLALAAQGSRSVFDAKTHRQMRQVFVRLNYAFLAGRLLRELPAGVLEDEIVDHLQQARQAQSRAWGQSELTRLGNQAGSTSVEAIGQTILNQVYRQALLGAITELWVDYLTRVEALRVSVGLEAYAQRDPLVQYKSQASEMFQTLLADIRGALVGRVFRYQPRAASAQQTESTPRQAAVAPAQVQSQGAGKKRKRHRH